MFRLPKGIPLFENLDACDLQLDNIITKLAHGCFTGYASLTFQTAVSILVFESGKLISIIFENNQGTNLNGFEAMTALAEQMQERASCTLNVYRLSGDLTMCIHALLQGEKLYRAQELALIDIKILLERIKNEQMNCCMRIYTNDRSVMIFYKGGNPLGFFHDGAEEIETSPG
ncbi:GTPase-activating protein, partial [bacterium]|nr:GTPase-activating protein [bacterium]